MPWCPACREEYREGFLVCSDCEIELVDQLEHLPIEDETNIPEDEEVLLTSVSDEMEAEIVEALLNSYEIPVFKRNKEAGGYMNIYMGFSRFGIDLFIPRSQLKKAKEIIENKKLKKLPEELEDITELSENTDIIEDVKDDKKRRISVWFILAFFLLPGLIWALINAGYFIYNYFFNR